MNIDKAGIYKKFRDVEVGELIAIDEERFFFKIHAENVEGDNVLQEVNVVNVQTNRLDYMDETTRVVHLNHEIIVSY